MLTNISIKNIKSYNVEASLKIAPLTLIYGPNSAGKSTLWKFLITVKKNNKVLTFNNLNSIKPCMK